MRRLLLSVFGFALLVHPVAAREWHDLKGRVIEGAMLGFLKGKVLIDLPSGERALLTETNLSADDRNWLEEWLAAHSGEAALAPVVWSQRVAHPPVKVTQAEPTGNGTLFRSANYEFQTDSAVSAGIMNDFATVAESTLRLVDDLPLTLPERGDSKLLARIFGSRAAFEKGGGQPGVAGMYLGSMLGRGGYLVVPMSSLGAQVFAGRFTKGYGYDAQVLIHEIAHQGMGEVLSFLPQWLAEGLAEYVACMPYHDGAFHTTMRDVGAGIRQRLVKMREIGQERDLFDQRKKTGTTIVKVSLPDLMKAAETGWAGDLRQKHRYYFTAQLLTTYLLRLDGDGQATKLRLALDEACAARKYLLTRGEQGKWPVDLSKVPAIDFNVVPKRINELVLAGRTWEQLEAQMLAAFSKEWGLTF
ncbi:MAG: hypothetical protein KDK97_06615 [Verrucomicrobiales bacterium]|nr:hypothetical protein [Verrucomicrobiales bacterium]MCP5560232.1 hypothetical protein [Verrucomicrobiaceae bacterium]